MIKLHFFRNAVASCLCLAVFACMAGSATSPWPIYKAGLFSYWDAHLPLPFVIYKFRGNGALDGIFIIRSFKEKPNNPNPNTQELNYTMGKMRQFVMSGKVKQPSPSQLVAYAKTFKQFFLDNGYNPNKAIAHDKTYTLFLAEPDLGQKICPRVTRELQRYLATIRKAIHSVPSSQSYAVIQLKLGSPNLKFGNCK